MTLKQKFDTEIIKNLQKELKIRNPMAVPKPTKVVVNMGVGRFRDDARFIESCINDTALICGQKPHLKRAKKSIAGFKIRQGDKIGLSVTLRGRRMWDFLEKLICIALPRTRDFRGIAKTALDGQGNLTVGIKEHTSFPEIDPNKVDKVKSMEVTIVTSAKNDEEGYKLLEMLGMPFKKSKDQ